MAGLKINICFWYVDDELIREIVAILVKGNYDPVFCNCKDIDSLKNNLDKQQIDLIISDFDLPDTLRINIEKIHKDLTFHIPLIFLVGEKNEVKAAETLKHGVWDYLLKSHFVKLVPTVYSSQKFGKVLKQSKKVQEELHETELKYQTIFNSVKDGILLIDFKTLSIIDFNKSIISLFGMNFQLSKEEVIDWLAGRNSCFNKKRIKELVSGLESNDSVNYICLNTNTKGEDFWTENTLSLFKIGDNIQYILLVRDIQEHKKMEESLQKSREHFRNLAENSPDIIMRFDNNFRHLYVNQTVFEQVKIPVENFINKSHEEMGVFPEYLVKFWSGAMQKVFKSGKPYRVEFDLPGDKEIQSFEWRLFPEFNEEGKTQTILAIARDITEQKISGAALKVSEERLKLAVEATSLGHWDWDLVTNEVFYSPIYFRMLGYEPDELPQKLDTWKNLLHEDDKERTIKTVENCIQNKDEAFEIEFRLLCKDGSYKWICSKGRATDISPEGKMRRLIGTHEDITERKRNEDIQKALFNISNAVNTTKNLDELYEKIREYLGRIIDTTNCFLAIYNADTKMLTLPFHRDELDSFNEFPAGKTLTGYVISTGKAQLVDALREKELTLEGLIEPVGSPCVSWLGVPLKSDSKIIGVFVVQSYNKEVQYTQEEVKILEFVSDQIALAIERKRDQDNIRESQEKQRRIFESSPDPIIVVNREGRVIDYNTRLLNALHITNEPVIGKKIFHFIDKQYWRIALNSFHKTWTDGYVKNLEFKVFRADGSSFESVVSTGSIYNKEGSPESMVIIFKDISDRKETERKLREAKEKAEESDRLKTAFLSNMSHEIRTPMNAIVGFADLLNDTEITEKEKSEFIAQINLGADNLMHLIDDIIDIAKIEAGQLKINKSEFDLRKLIDEQLVMFRQNLESLDKTHLDLRLNWNMTENIVLMNTDPFRLKQIMSNLLNNAIKFTDSGFIELGVELFNGFIKIYIKDTGIGIEEQKQKVIFDRFMQGHITKGKLYGGTGLGLAISKNLSELLGGSIGVISTRNVGSEFWFTLPYTPEDTKKSTKITAIKKSKIHWDSKKILIAEDDISNFKLLSEALKTTNAELIWARDGNETIRLFKEHGHSLNLVLMDIQMPEMDGYNCTRIIKKENPTLPVIAQTAYAMQGEIELSKEAGCDDHIHKPLQINNLITILAPYLK